MTKILNLIVGGVIGTVARYFLSGFLTQLFGTKFPIGTLVVNLIGCFLIGFFARYFDKHFFLSPYDPILLIVGFCGAFTTFSTFILETSNLVGVGQNFSAFLNIMASVAIGFLVFKLGGHLGELVA